MKKRLSIQLCQKITDCKNDETKQSRLHSHWIILWSSLRHPKQFFLYDFSLLLPKLKEILYKSNFELKDRNKKKYHTEEAVPWSRCSAKKLFEKISQNSQEHTWEYMPLFQATCNFAKKKIRSEVFFSRFSEILRSKSMDRFLYDNGLRHERVNLRLSLVLLS